MTQELKPCPFCETDMQEFISVRTDVFSTHIHPYNGCLLEGLEIDSNVQSREWNAAPRRNDPEWLPQWLPIKAKAPIKIIRSVWVWADGHNVTHAVFSYGQGRWVHYSHPIEPIDFTPTHYCEHEYVPNPPEVTT